MECESCVTRIIIGELYSSEIQQDEMAGGNGITGTIIDELHSSDINGDQLEVKVVLREVSLMNFNLRISKEIKWRVKVVLLEVSLINFIVRISSGIKW